jgi:hypothetical protein
MAGKILLAAIVLSLTSAIAGALASPCPTFRDCGPTSEPVDPGE